MERAIITGATGAVGTALIRCLVSQGKEVLVFCRKGSDRNQNIPPHPLITVKYCELEQLRNIQNDTGKTYDVFYHLAWAGTVGSGRNDVYLQNANVRYALDAVGAAKRFGCKNFIGAGSQAEYGRTNNVLRPDTPVSPETAYGYAKLCAGYMTRDYAHQLGLAHIWIRILSVYGPCDGPQSMVMSTISKLQKGITPHFTAGEQLWDYLYSGDAAEAFARAGEKGKDGKVYVLGSGQAHPLKEYIFAIRDVVSPQASLGIGDIPYGPGQVMCLCADTSEIKRDTGWTAQTPFRSGIRQIINQEK